jgi:uncharacterized delta-60 repeat protein
MTIKMLKGRRRESRLRAVRMATLALILVCSQPLSTWAADGDLDKSFGMGGIVLTQFDTQVDENGAFSEGRTVAIQTDGKIVAGGETDHNGRTMDAALARYNPDGSLDATFGSGGKVITANTQGLDVIAIQSDGKIVAASQRELLRYTTDGSLDPSFGSGGMAATGGALVHALALQPDRKIIVGGEASLEGDTSFVFAVLRFDPDGGPDAGFGTGGEALADFPGHASGISSLAFQPDGKIIAAGSGQLPGIGFAAMARFNPDGSLDATFGVSGLVTRQTGPSVLALAVRDGGAILAIGRVSPPTDVLFGVARYDSDGSLDSAFGSGGVAAAPFFSGNPNRHLDTVAIGPDGKFIAAGGASFGLALARYNSDGSPDTTFGAGGSVITHITDPRVRDGDGVAAIAFQADGQIVVAGTSGGDTNDLVLARYNTEPDFALEVSSSTENMAPGARAKVVLNIARLGGYIGNVTVTAPDTSALDIRIIPDSVTTTADSVKFKIKVRGDTPPGSHPLVFAAQSEAGQAHSVTLTLVVQ